MLAPTVGEKYSLTEWRLIIHGKMQLGNTSSCTNRHSDAKWLPAADHFLQYATTPIGDIFIAKSKTAIRSRLSLKALKLLFSLGVKPIKLAASEAFGFGVV